MLEKRGCEILNEHKAPSFVALVKDFYANMVRVKEEKVCVRGKCISFSRETINETFNLKVKKRVKIQETVKRARIPKDYGPINRRKRKMEGNKENST